MKYRYMLLFSLLLLGCTAYGQVAADWADISSVQDILNESRKGEDIFPNIDDMLRIDTAFKKKIINAEFRSSRVRPYPDTSGISYFMVPYQTTSIVWWDGERYAVSRLYDYYRKLPKFTRSDTIYEAYHELYTQPESRYGTYYWLDECLALLIYYQQPGLAGQLKKDYIKWKQLAAVAPSKQYPSLLELRSARKEKQQKLSATDFYPDCNLMMLHLAGALNALKEPGFNDSLLTALKKQQTYPLAENYVFKKYDFLLPEKQRPRFPNDTIKLDKTYKNIVALIRDKEMMTHQNLYQSGSNPNTAPEYNIVHNDRDKAILYIRYRNGGASFLLTLTHGNILVKELLRSFII